MPQTRPWPALPVASHGAIPYNPAHPIVSHPLENSKGFKHMNPFTNTNLAGQIMTFSQVVADVTIPLYILPETLQRPDHIETPLSDNQVPAIAHKNILGPLISRNR